jgi:tRNA-uridine 2-sulfurtransferase
LRKPAHKEENTMTDRRPRALSMFSGGLDSLVATKFLMRLGVEVVALHFTAPFIDRRKRRGGAGKAESAAAALGVPLRVVDVWPDFLPLLRRPHFGFGKHLNPCIDCKIFFLQQAKIVMDAEGFDFVFTGEVKGQRPMSQNSQSLDNIQRVSGLGDRLLRPLSAKVLPPTHPEITGMIDREKLLGITGRGRHDQHRLAAELGIDNPPGSGGGCLLTDGNYAGRLRHLLRVKENPTHTEMNLLVIGRHLALGGDAKVIVSRDEWENDELERFAGAGDVLLWPDDWSGPHALIIGADSAEALATAAALVLRWGKPDAEAAVLARKTSGGPEFHVSPAPPFSEAEIDAMHVHLREIEAIKKG